MRALMISIGDREYGIKLENVREVIAFPDVTPIPDVPPHMLGIMNLREKVIPLVDLRVRLKVTPTLTHDTAVVICEVNSVVIGLVVDSIHTVIAPEEANIMQISPAHDDGGTSQLVSAVIRNENNLVLIFDLPILVSMKDIDLKAMAGMAKTAGQTAKQAS